MSHSHADRNQVTNGNRPEHALKSQPVPQESPAPSAARRGQDPEFEIGLARVHLARLLNAQDRATERDRPDYEAEIVRSLSLIISLIASAARHKQGDSDLHGILAGLSHAQNNLRDRDGTNTRPPQNSSGC